MITQGQDAASDIPTAVEYTSEDGKAQHKWHWSMWPSHWAKTDVIIKNVSILQNWQEKFAHSGSLKYITPEGSPDIKKAWSAWHILAYAPALSKEHRLPAIW